MGSSQPWINTARNLVKLSKEAEQPVLIDQAVKAILKRHPDCPIPEAKLVDMLLNLVIDERGSLIDDVPITKPSKSKKAA
jgi:hypothetical protein